MKTDTPSLETPQAARLRRRQLIRQLLERDKTPLAILFMAAVVGTLVGLAAVAFDKGRLVAEPTYGGTGTYC